MFVGMASTREDRRQPAVSALVESYGQDAARGNLHPRHQRAELRETHLAVRRVQLRFRIFVLLEHPRRGAGSWTLHHGDRSRGLQEKEKRSVLLSSWGTNCSDGGIWDGNERSRSFGGLLDKTNERYKRKTRALCMSDTFLMGTSHNNNLNGDVDQTNKMLL